jgi:hypothetical protein
MVDDTPTCRKPMKLRWEIGPNHAQFSYADRESVRSRA